VFKANKIQGRQTAITNHAVIVISGSWDWFMQERSAVCRDRLGKAQQKLNQLGPVSFHRWRPQGLDAGDTSRRWDLFAQFAQTKIADESSKSKAEIDLTFLRDLHPAAVDAGSVEICSLTIRGRTGAVSYGYHNNGNLDLLFLGAAHEVGDDGVQVLIVEMLRDSFMRDDSRLLFHADQSQFAELWSNGHVEAVTCGHYNMLSPQAQLLKMKRAKKDKGASVAGKDAVPTLSDGAGVKV
jgi:hypothetical protein